MKLFFTIVLSVFLGSIVLGQCPSGSTQEVFEDGSSTPAGWIVDDQRTGYWRVDNTDIVQTAPIDVSAYSSVTVNIEVATWGGATTPSPANIEFSTDGGVTFDPNVYTTNTPSSTTYIDGGNFTFPVPANTSNLVIRMTKGLIGSSFKNVRIRNFYLCGLSCSLLAVDNNDATCVAFTSGVDSYTYTIGFNGGGQGAGTYTITSSNGVVDLSGGNDPNVDTDGNITVTVDEGLDDMFSITDGGSCSYSYNITSPDCIPSGPLVITEIMYNTPTPGDDDEWVEICNIETSSVDVTGYSIESNGSIQYTFPSYSIAGNECIVVSLGSKGDGQYNSTAGCRFFPTLGVPSTTSNTNNMVNSSTAVILYEADGVTVADDVIYDDADGGDGGGSSLHVVDATLDNSDTGTNWTTVPNGGSPFMNSTVSTCPPCEAPTRVQLASTTTTLTAADGCDAADGYTYYSASGTEDFMFAINWAPDGTLSTNNETAKDNASIVITTAAPGTEVDNTTQQGTWTMGRYWNASTGGNDLDENVDIKFFYDTNEKSGTDGAASSSGFSPVETSVWFKTVGIDFDPTQITPGSVGQNAIPLTVVSDGNTENGITYVEFSGVESFSGGTYAAGAGDAAAVNALPVTIGYFEVQAQDDKVLLEWSTAQEINNERFDIQRMTDSGTFETIGSVEGKGTTSTKSTYSYIDENPVTGMNYYKLRQVDYEGKSTYSQVKAVEMDVNDPIKIYPTLVANTLRYQVNEAAKMIIMSIDGSVYKEVYIEGNSSIDMTDFGPGMYTVTINTASKTKTERIIKL